jgi:hypothetical protein
MRVISEPLGAGQREGEIGEENDDDDAAENVVHHVRRL